MESHKNKINLTFSATTHKYTWKKVFSVQLLYKSSVQKIKLNQNEFPMKHTQVKQLFNHTIIMEKKFVKHCATLKNITHYTSYYIVVDKTSKHYKQSLQWFQEIYHTTIQFTMQMMTISPMHQEPKPEPPWEAPSPEDCYSG